MSWKTPGEDGIPTKFGEMHRMNRGKMEESQVGRTSEMKACGQQGARAEK